MLQINVSEKTKVIIRLNIFPPRKTLADIWLANRDSPYWNVSPSDPFMAMHRPLTHVAEELQTTVVVIYPRVWVRCRHAQSCSRSTAGNILADRDVGRRRECELRFGHVTPRQP